MIDPACLMTWSDPVPGDIERGAVRKFAEAIGDTNPLYVDEAVARTSRFGRIIAPPTFAMTLDYGDIPGLHFPQEGLIHGEQTFYYERPLFVGERVFCSRRLCDVSTRRGASGSMTFLVFESRCQDADGHTVQSARMTLIVRGGEENA